MKEHHMGKRYANEDIYYADREERLRSPEANFGIHWRDNGLDMPRYMITYVRDTCEVVAFRLARPSWVEVLGLVAPDSGSLFYRTLDAILPDWGKHCLDDPHGLQWIRDRLEAYSRGAVMTGIMVGDAISLSRTPTADTVEALFKRGDL